MAERPVIAIEENIRQKVEEWAGKEKPIRSRGVLDDLSKANLDKDLWEYIEQIVGGSNWLIVRMERSGFLYNDTFDMTFVPIQCLDGCTIGDQEVVAGHQYEVKKHAKERFLRAGVFLFIYYK